MKSVRCARPVPGWIGQRIDDLQLLDYRAGPAMRDDERQRIVMFRTDVNEMNIQSIDLGDELRQSVQFRLAFAPIVIRRPIAREFLNHGERHALRIIRDCFPFRPPRRIYALAQFGEFGFRKTRLKWSDSGVIGHSILPS